MLCFLFSSVEQCYCSTLSRNEYALKPEKAVRKSYCWGTVEVVSTSNKKLDCFAARTRDPQVLTVDALMTMWDQLQLMYALPPPSF